MRFSDWSSDVCSSDLRIFDEVLCPQFDAPDARSPPRPYNLTLGVPLADCGFVQTALRLLQLASGELDAAALSALLCAGDWGEGEDDRLERGALDARLRRDGRSEEHTSELQSLMRRSYAVIC